MDDIPAWLDKIDWEKQWSASHLFWGGMHCYSFSALCTDEWKRAVREWLLANCDESTGYWRRGTVYTDRHQALGGLAHILPIFEHQDWEFPFIRKTVDSVLAMQLPSTLWISGNPYFPATYLDLDALYVLRYSKTYDPGYRAGDIKAACEAYAETVLAAYINNKHLLYNQHPHQVLAAVGIFGLLQFLLPNKFTDDREWSDIFSDRRLYQTDEVEVIKN